MKQYSKYFIAGGAFLSACIVAFIITNIIIGKNELPSSTSNDDAYVADVEDSVGVKKEASQKDVPSTGIIDDASYVTPEITVISQEAIGNTYTLHVVCTHVPEGTSVSYRIDAIGKSSKDGSFKGIPGSKTGKYTVEAYDNASNAVIATKEIDGFVQKKEEPTVQKMSVAEFQRLLLNQNDNSLLGGKNPRVARYVHLTCVGLRDGDYAAGDIQHVRDKIGNGIWKTAVVTSVGYNERGQINSATIRPVYSEE